MAEKNQMRTPSGAAGLVRYDEGDDSTIIKMKPMHVVALATVLVIIEAMMLILLPI
jgi:preprotein translocase subunit Sec61beta